MRKTSCPRDATAKTERKGSELLILSILKVKLYKRLFATGNTALNIFNVNLGKSLVYEFVCFKGLVID